MRDPRLHRVVIVGTGTGVGKTHLARSLVRELVRSAGPERVVGLKPVETGAPYADAAALDAETGRQISPHPRYALPEPLSPHLAARRAGAVIELDKLVEWVAKQESVLTLSDNILPYVGYSVVETAGGVLSPLAPGVRNFELARALDPAHWVLVAPDRLGVLHELSATLLALEHLGRTPDSVVLSAPAIADASTGSNAAELALLGVAQPVLSLAWGESDVSLLVAAINAPRS